MPWHQALHKIMPSHQAKTTVRGNVAGDHSFLRRNKRAAVSAGALQAAAR
eukprot:gene13342-17091_t